jgi:hypothetical protein
VRLCRAERQGVGREHRFRSFCMRLGLAYLVPVSPRLVSHPSSTRQSPAAWFCIANHRMMSIIQPCHMVTITAALRVSHALALPSPIVAYQVCYAQTISPQTAIKLMIDGMLLQELTCLYFRLPLYLFVSYFLTARWRTLCLGNHNTL